MHTIYRHFGIFSLLIFVGCSSSEPERAATDRAGVDTNGTTMRVDLRLVAYPAKDVLSLTWNPGGWTDIEGHRVDRDDIKEYLNGSASKTNTAFNLIASDSDAMERIVEQISALRDFVRPEVRGSSRFVVNIVVRALRRLEAKRR